MPVTNISLLRSFSEENPPNPPPSTEPAYVPPYAVLFYYKGIDFWNTDNNIANNGNINVDYYRRYYISDPKSLGSNFYYYDTNGNKLELNSFPVIKCIDTNTDWKDTLGKLEYPTTSMLPNAATLLENGGGHNPLSMLRTEVKPIPGFRTGDTQDSVKTYIDRSTPHGGHIHFIRGIQQNLLSTVFGRFLEVSFKGTSLANTSTSNGFLCYEIDTIIRDPKLSKKDEKLRYLPKNMIVFGDDLPSQYYTRTHPDVGNTYTQTIINDSSAIPLLAKYKPNYVDGLELLSNMITSNASGSHTHSIATSVKKLSTVTGQTSFNFVDSGLHTHQVYYNYAVDLKAKTLKTWITQSANTPIANGVIIAYSNGVESGYSGNITDSTILPPYWHFCNGDNGTPDLRDYYVCANFSSSDHDVEINPSSTATLLNINVQLAGKHTHYSPTSSVQDGTPITVGGHGEENNLDHIHGISAAISFINEDQKSPVTNIKPGAVFDYTPPTTRLAFIMYNENIP